METLLSPVNVHVCLDTSGIHVFTSTAHNARLDIPSTTSDSPIPNACRVIPGPTIDTYSLYLSPLSPISPRFSLVAEQVPRLLPSIPSFTFFPTAYNGSQLSTGAFLCALHPTRHNPQTPPWLGPRPQRLLQLRDVGKGSITLVMDYRRSTGQTGFHGDIAAGRVGTGVFDGLRPDKD